MKPATLNKMNAHPLSKFYIAGIVMGVAIGLLDTFFPSDMHNLLYYFLVYFSIGMLAIYVGRGHLSWNLPVRILGIASLSMGFWAITWSSIFFAFHPSSFIYTFLVRQSIGIGLGIYVPIGIYIFSTVLQSVGGAFLIYLSGEPLNRLIPLVGLWQKR